MNKRNVVCTLSVFITWLAIAANLEAQCSLSVSPAYDAPNNRVVVTATLGAMCTIPGATVSVVVTDTFGRAWREGHTNVAIGIAGLPALKRYVGQRDPEGYELRVTEIAVADEIAGAAELVMGKLDRCPVALVRGFTLDEPAETAQEYVRPADRDLFR